MKPHGGNGIGQNLLTATLRHAWQSGLKRVELFASNTAAISLYDKIGFQHEGIKRNARCIDGNYEDVCIMAQCRI